MDKLLDLYSDYLIAQNQYATAVGLSDLLERVWKPSSNALNGNFIIFHDVKSFRACLKSRNINASCHEDLFIPLIQ